MQRLMLTALLALPLFSQQTRVEKTMPATPPSADAKPDSPNVPDVIATTTQFERVVVLRFKHQAELLSTLEGAVKQNKIRNGVILSAFGSVRNYQYHTVSNRTFPSKDTFVKDPTAPADIISMGGFIMNGRVHPHITLSTPDKAMGGHLEPGTNVFTFAVVTIGVLPDALDLSRLDDKTYR